MTIHSPVRLSQLTLTNCAMHEDGVVDGENEDEHEEEDEYYKRTLEQR